jgi:starch synthase
MIKHCYDYQFLGNISTVLTIHNGQYQGWMSWDKSKFIPRWDLWKRGLLEWEGNINPLACGVKCADTVTTVSQSYMDELRVNANGLEKLFEFERGKCVGILNGIDHDVWNPLTDAYITKHFGINSVMEGKEQNKLELCEEFGLDPTKPLFVFIGRLVGEKAADILPDAIKRAIHNTQGDASFLILGSGENKIEWDFMQMKEFFTGIFNAVIGYNEKLSHKMYAGADFLLMPSRVEPCGLNQLYALRYGTVPIVRNTGGLRDTVIDMGILNGYGICFDQASVHDIDYSIGRAVSVYQDKVYLEWMRKFMMNIDHSWESTVNRYKEVYLSTKF